MPMMRKSILVSMLVVCFSTPTPARPDARPNILVLMAEDMSARVGSFGDEVAVTPHIDQLAKQGVRYPNTFTAAGVCAPSRAAHITGMHPISFGGQHMRASSGPLGSYKAVPPPEVKAYPELLRGVGYYTWTDRKLDYQFSGVMSGSGPSTIWDDQGSQGHWRNREPGQPFFGLVNFNITHESGVFTPLGSWPNSPAHLLMQVMRAAMLPSVEEGSPVQPDQIVVPPYYPDTPTVRADMARHYNNIAVMDEQVGELLAELEADGLADSTLIIWTTDHGDGLPRAKRDLFDTGINVPMIIRWPDAHQPADVAPGSVDPRLVSFVDLAPTVLRLAGEPVPDFIQGQDLRRDEKRQYVFASRDRIDEVRDRQRAVRDSRYKYIRSYYPEQPGGHHLDYRDNMAMMQELWSLLEAGKLNESQRQWFEAPGEERLFDLQADPFELSNLVDDPAYSAPLGRMRTALSAWQDRVEDWSEVSEADMLGQFWPQGEMPGTAAPELLFRSGLLYLSCVTPGASMEYRLNGGRWKLYTNALAIETGSEIEARAVRYGWQESDIVQHRAP